MDHVRSTKYQGRIIDTIEKRANRVPLAVRRCVFLAQKPGRQRVDS